MELNKEELLKLYPPYTSILGPYSRPDGRKHVILNNSNATSGDKNKIKTISYPKALVESNIGRRLLPNETIDHHDRNKTNDTQDNLKIRDRSEHSALNAVRVHVDAVHCVGCGKLFTPSKSQRNSQASNSGQEPAGPFCSRHCTGIYGASIQNGGKKLKRQGIVKHYQQEEK